MNKKLIIGIAVGVAIAISVIVISYANLSSTTANNVGTINQSVNSTSQVPPITSGHNYTINLNEAVSVKNP